MDHNFLDITDGEKMKGTIIQRGKTWSFVVDIGKGPTTGQRRQKTKGGFLRKKDYLMKKHLPIRIHDIRHTHASYF